MKTKTKKVEPKQHKNAVARVRKYFPQVNQVVDAKTPVLVTVTKADNAKGRKKDPSKCAMAQACMRQERADGAIINITKSYIIKGDTAYRYKTSETVAREIVSFDRHQDFAEGRNYRLSPPPHSECLGQKSQSDKSGPHTGKAKEWRVHHTVAIRNFK